MIGGEWKREMLAQKLDSVGFEIPASVLRASYLCQLEFEICVSRGRPMTFGDRDTGRMVGRLGVVRFGFIRPTSCMSCCAGDEQLQIECGYGRKVYYGLRDLRDCNGLDARCGRIGH